MKTTYAILQTKWQALTLREKQMVGIGGVVLGLFILYQFMIAPVFNHLAGLREQIKSQQQLLIFMQSADRTLQTLSNPAALHHRLSSATLLSAIQKQIQAANLEGNVVELKQVASDTIHLQFQKVDFDASIQLLMMLNQQFSLSIRQLSVMATPDPGIVHWDGMLVWQ